MVQRYGADVAGGAEALARSTARALAERGAELRILTTTARDYLRWEPAYDEGRSEVDGLPVRRFDAEKPDPERAADLTRALTLAPGDAATENDWARAQGPVCPGLLAELEADTSDVVVFWTYLYATTQLGLPLTRGRAVLVPLAHDEPPFRTTLSRGVVRIADGLAFLTPEERRLVHDIHDPDPRAEMIVGAGIDEYPVGDPDRGRRLVGADDYVLYLGRVDPAKGVLSLIAAHDAYRRDGGRLPLILGGRATDGVSLPTGARALGFLEEKDRRDITAGARAVALPSRHESLSLVALEAWRAGVPTLANAASEVLAAQTARSGGGLLWFSDEDYGRALRRLEDPGRRSDMGARGAAWTANWSWDACADRWEGLLGAVHASPDTQDGSRHPTE